MVIIYPSSGGTIAQPSQPSAGGNQPVTYQEGMTKEQTPFAQLESGKGSFAESAARGAAKVESSSGGAVYVGSPYVARSSTGQIIGPATPVVRGPVQLAAGQQQTDVSAYNLAYGAAGEINKPHEGQQYVVVTQEQGGGYVVSANPQLPKTSQTSIMDQLRAMLGGKSSVKETDKGFVVGSTESQQMIQNVTGPPAHVAPSPQSLLLHGTGELPEAPKPPSLTGPRLDITRNVYTTPEGQDIQLTPSTKEALPSKATPAEAVAAAGRAAARAGAAPPAPIQTPETIFYSTSLAGAMAPLVGKIPDVSLFQAKGVVGTPLAGAVPQITLLATGSRGAAEAAVGAAMNVENLLKTSASIFTFGEASSIAAGTVLARTLGLRGPSYQARSEAVANLAAAAPYYTQLPIVATFLTAEALTPKPTTVLMQEKTVLKETTYAGGKPIAERVGMQGTEAYRDILSKNFGTEYFQNIPGIGELYVRGAGQTATRGLLVPGEFTGMTVSGRTIFAPASVPGLSLSGFAAYGGLAGASQVVSNIVSGKPAGENVARAVGGGLLLYPAFEAVGFAAGLPRPAPQSEIVKAPGFRGDVISYAEPIPVKDIRGFYQELLPAPAPSRAIAEPVGPQPANLRPATPDSVLKSIYPGFFESKGGTPIVSGKQNQLQIQKVLPIEEEEVSFQLALPKQAEISTQRPQPPAAVQPPISLERPGVSVSSTLLKGSPLSTEYKYSELAGVLTAPSFQIAPPLGKVQPIELPQPQLAPQPSKTAPPPTKNLYDYSITTMTETSMMEIPAITPQIQIQPSITEPKQPSPTVISIIPGLPAIGFPPPPIIPRAGGGGPEAFGRGGKFPASVRDLLGISRKAEKAPAFKVPKSAAKPIKISIGGVSSMKFSVPKTRLSANAFRPAPIGNPFGKAKKSKKRK